jgi:uncharacterized protein HemY
MNALAQSLLSTSGNGLLNEHDVSRFTAGEVREAISSLVADDKLPLADALCEAGLSLHPGDENILSMAALMANLHQDWARSEEYLRELMAVQGNSTTEFTWNLLVRVLRCQAEPIEALSVVRDGLMQHPESADLLREKAELEAFFGDATILIQPAASWQ